jgi:hypothetical protein
LVAAQPLRERPWARLMTALYRTGQRADALASYRQLRAHLIDELGVEPGPGVRDLHQQVLAGGPLPATRLAPLVLTARVAPRQLRPDVRHFAGRITELSLLDDVLCGDTAGAAVVATINGTAGVGKTALAVRWAHQMANCSPTASSTPICAGTPRQARRLARGPGPVLARAGRRSRARRYGRGGRDVPIAA